MQILHSGATPNDGEQYLVLRNSNALAAGRYLCKKTVLGQADSNVFGDGKYAIAMPIMRLYCKLRDSNGFAYGKYSIAMPIIRLNGAKRNERADV